VGKLLVECFNESFAKGEMSPSQRQAVITLLEKKDKKRCDLKVPLGPEFWYSIFLHF